MGKRLDLLLFEKNLVETRSKAKQLIENGCVFVDDVVAKKPSVMIDETQKLEIKNSFLKYVSRAGNKLEKALSVFNVSIEGKIVLDVGASTGGFTDCSLKNGAQKVIAVDVGSEQFSEKLRGDLRVDLYEKMDIRDIPDEVVSGAEVAVVDVSFISVLKIVEKLAGIRSITDVLLLIKPQFECGAEVARKTKGIVKDDRVYRQVIGQVVDGFSKQGFGLCGLDFSPVLGGDGNVEFLAHFNRRGAVKNQLEFSCLVSDVICAAKNFRKEHENASNNRKI